MIWRSEFIKVYVVTMLMALCLLSCSSDDTLSSTASSNSVPVSLAMNISTSRVSTRMTEAVTQQAGQDFRGIQDQRLFPFDADALVDNLIVSGKSPLSTYITDIEKYNEEADNLHYFDDRSVEIPNETVAFLCYCRATPSGTKFENGSLITNIVKENAADELDWTTSSTADIKFEPEKIYTAVENNKVSVPSSATTIAEYLTNIANAHIAEDETKTWSSFSQSEAQEFSSDLTELRSLFRQFVNEGHPIACSSVYAEKCVNWLYAQLQSLNPEANSDAANIKNAILVALANGGTVDPTATKKVSLDESMMGYPANITLPEGNITLPEGAAVVQWNAKKKVFTAQVESSTTANVNSLNRFVYPPELYYYANSRIKTSKSSRKQDYTLKSWNAVLNTYDEGYGKMDYSVQSVAIIDPLSYAVGCLQVGLNVQNPLKDATGEKNISLTGGVNASFPLTAILVSSQFAQGYDFTPKGEADEYIIYDNQIEDYGISMGAPNTPTSSIKYTNTLVLQTKDNEKVRFALEFENNSGVDFEGCNGTVFDGTKFYLVGTIEVPVVGEQDVDFKKRVFTKNHLTKGVITISSLKEAYTYLPDLLDPRLEVGIQLIPDWIQSTTINVPL